MTSGNLEYALEVITRSFLGEADAYEAFYIREALKCSVEEGTLDAGDESIRTNLSPRYRPRLNALVELFHRLVDAREELKKDFNADDPRWSFEPLPSEEVLARYTDRWKALKYIEATLPGLTRRLKTADLFGDDAQQIKTAIVLLRTKQKELQKQP
ncbi:MAG: hypothetical protein WCO51_01680 [bacterium]|jgi:hypothetical protein